MFAQLQPVADRLDRLSVPWVLGGSMASMLVGEIRLTTDIDLAIVISEMDAARLVSAFESEYYIDAEMIRDAVVRGSSFNIIHFASGTKIDMFVNGTSLLDRRQFERRIRTTVDLPDADEPFDVWIAPVEDQIVRKLWWHRIGGEVSAAQLRDVAGMIAVAGDALDLDDLQALAAEVGVSDLLKTALGK